MVIVKAGEKHTQHQILAMLLMDMTNPCLLHASTRKLSVSSIDRNERTKHDINVYQMNYFFILNLPLFQIN